MVLSCANHLSPIHSVCLKLKFWSMKQCLLFPKAAVTPEFLRSLNCFYVNADLTPHSHCWLVWRRTKRPYKFVPPCAQTRAFGSLITSLQTRDGCSVCETKTNWRLNLGAKNVCMELSFFVIHQTHCLLLPSPSIGQAHVASFLEIYFCSVADSKFRSRFLHAGIPALSLTASAIWERPTPFRNYVKLIVDVRYVTSRHVSYWILKPQFTKSDRSVDLKRLEPAVRWKKWVVHIMVSNKHR